MNEWRTRTPLREQCLAPSQAQRPFANSAEDEREGQPLAGSGAVARRGFRHARGERSHDRGRPWRGLSSGLLRFPPAMFLPNGRWSDLPIRVNPFSGWRWNGSEMAGM